MNTEDLFYFRFLLSRGFSEEYNLWLNEQLTHTDPYPDILTELALCGNDINKTISVLHNFCLTNQTDSHQLCERLRNFLKNEYHSDRLSKKEVVYQMRGFINCAHQFDEINLNLLSEMPDLSDEYDLAEDEIISWERFDYVFLSYLNDGTHIPHKFIWNRPYSPSLWQRFISWIRLRRK